MFRITKQWLNAHKTESGGVTKAQIILLGIDWPPPRGWMSRLEGCQISDDDRSRFELGKHIKLVKQHKTKRKQHGYRIAKSLI
jgi:hypothetical protein